MGPSARPFIRLLDVHAPLVLGLLLVPLALSSQESPQTPQIHVSTQLVQIGIIVRDKNGPVAGLTKDDFSVFDRGKAQKISVFSVESGASAPPLAQPAQPLPPNTFSDLPQHGSNKPRSVTIVLLDNLNTVSGSSPAPYETTPYWLEDHALANAKQHLLEFLEQMDASDLIAIYGLTDSLHVLCDFTCDRAQLLAVVSKYDPTAKTQREAAEPGRFHLPNVAPEFNAAIDADVLRLAALNNQERAEATMAALVAISAHVSDIPGRKNLLWLTANLPYSGQAIARILSRSNIAAYPLDARGLLPRAPTTSFEVEPVRGAQLRSVLGLDAPADQSDQPIGIDTMQKMADETGGRAFVNTNDLTGAIRTAVDDSAVTYTLGFYIDSDSLDGKFHELKVKVKRPGLEVRYPKGYFALKDAPASKDELYNSLVAAIRSPLDASAIPLQIKVDRVNRPAPNSLRLLGSIGIPDLQLVQKGETRLGELDITIIEQDQTGKVLCETANRIDLRFTEKQYAAVLQSGINFRKSLQPQAGVTTLRVLVQDPGSGAIGSLIIPLSNMN